MFMLSEGQSWDIYYYGHKHKAPVEMPGDGKRGRSKVLITYNPARLAEENRAKPDRSTIQFAVIDQHNKRFNTPDAGKAETRFEACAAARILYNDTKTDVIGPAPVPAFQF